MDKTIDITIKEYVAEVALQTQGLVSVYLFGSYAKDKQRPDSDIDIAFVYNELSDVDKFDWQVKLIMIAANFDSRIEPHPITIQDINSGNPFAFEITNTGIRII